MKASRLDTWRPFQKVGSLSAFKSWLEESSSKAIAGTEPNRA